MSAKRNQEVESTEIHVRANTKSRAESMLFKRFSQENSKAITWHSQTKWKVITWQRNNQLTQQEGNPKYKIKKIPETLPLGDFNFLF